jgi:hypothetical protein
MSALGLRNDPMTFLPAHPLRIHGMTDYKQLSDFPSTAAAQLSDVFYSQNVTTNTEQKTTLQQIQGAALAPIAMGASTDAGTLQGTEIFPLGRAGLFQTTLTKIATWVLQTFHGFTQGALGSTARTVQSKLVDLPSSPRDFGAIGNGTSNPASNLFSSLAQLQAVYPFATSLYQEMDYLGWQAALNAGGGVYSPQVHYIMCNSNPASQTPLTIVAGQSWVEGHAAQWDFSAMTVQTTAVNYVSNYNFAQGATGWANSTIWNSAQITPVMFSVGSANYVDPALFNTFTGAVSSAGILTVTNFSGASSIAVGQTLYGPGIPTGVTIGSFSSGTGGNGNYNLTGWNGTTVAASTMNTSGGHFCQFGTQVTLPPGRYRAICTVTATLGASYANGNPNPAYGGISFFQYSPGNGGNVAGNALALTGLSAIQNGPVTQTIELDFIVNATTTTWFTFSGGGYGNFSFTYMDIVPWLANCAVLATRDGAVEHYPIAQPVEGIELIGPGPTVGVSGVLYKSFSNLDGNLVRIDRSSIHSFGYGLNLQDGAYLTQFNGVDITENGICINYPGGVNSGENFRFYGGTLGNSSVSVNNPGGAEFTFFGTALDYATQAITNNAGRIELHGVHAEMDVPVTAGYPLFQCINGGCIEMHGGMFLGAGSVDTAAEPPINLASAMSTFIFNGTQVYNLSSAAGVAASGPGMLRFEHWRNTGNPNIGPTLLSNSVAMDLLGGSGTFETLAYSVPFTGVDPSGINLAGGLYPPSGSTSVSQWSSSAYTVGVSTAQAQSGTRSLSVQKTLGNGTTGQLAFIVPAQPGHDMLGTISFLFPNNVGTGTGTLYFRSYWAKVIAYDTYGRPIFDNQNMFRGENDIQVPLAGSNTWITRAISTQYTTDSSVPTSDVSPGAPQWATHLAVLIDMESIPAMTFFIDNFIINQL